MCAAVRARRDNRARNCPVGADHSTGGMDRQNHRPGDFLMAAKKKAAKKATKKKAAKKKR